VFLVPLRTGGFARGVVARYGAEAILLGYFFPFRMALAAAPATALEPNLASHRLRFSDLSLLQGTWPIVDAVAPWDRSRWPMPEFRSRSLPGASVGLRVRVAEDEPGRELSATPATIEELASLPSSAVYGSGAIEILLTRDHEPGYRSAVRADVN
jgi:hypothetical protein